MLCSSFMELSGGNWPGCCIHCMCAVTTKKCATACAGTAPPPDDAFTSKYNNPSEYSKRYTLAGEAKLMLLLLGNVILPADFWEWYLQRAGRSELTNSFATYVAAYIAAFGNRLPYLRDASRALATVTFAKSMLSWYVSVGGLCWVCETFCCLDRVYGHGMLQSLDDSVVYVGAMLFVVSCHQTLMCHCLSALATGRLQQQTRMSAASCQRPSRLPSKRLWRWVSSLQQTPPVL